ncbi:hypothetical protein E4T56_gene12923 [Termitomyces sp. T112]|nr:hypothetical protein E4T56_gene12923 [Termitomyces sp. T112]
MDLVLVHNDPANTLLTSNSGVQFKVETPKNEPTSIFRAKSEASTGSAEILIGHLELRGTRDLRLRFCDIGSELILHPKAETDLDISWTFLGPDSRPYKWQIFFQYPVFTLNDNSNTLLARYRRAKLGIVSRSRKAFIQITPAGLDVADLIVVTFVAFMKQRFMIDYYSAGST